VRKKGSWKAGSQGGPLVTSVLCCIALAFMVGAPLQTMASPRFEAAPVVLAAVPDWMDEATASRLALDFDVLVPPWLPDPFTGSPAVSTASGYYELYWVITGGPPTFLQITGSVGGDIPDFSWYDRNNELKVNADVGGVPAYRDLTPIYDNVYWEVNDVVYTVSAQGLTETDSLALANSLVRLEHAPPPPPELEQDPASLSTAATVTSGSLLDVTVTNGNGATLNASRGAFIDTGDATYANLDNATVTWRAPEVTSEESVTFSLTHGSTGNWLAGATTIVLPAVAPAPDLSLSCPSTIASGQQGVIAANGAGTVVLDSSYGNWPAFGSNTDFTTSAGGSQISGTIGGSGSVELLWQAPETRQSLVANVTISGMTGATTASCTIEVEPSTAPDAATSTPVPASDASGGPGSTATPPPVSDAPPDLQRSTRSRQGRATSNPTPVSRPRNSLRFADDDGTGGARHPDFVGSPSGIEVDSPLIAPTSAPLPAAPRPVRSSGANADQRQSTEDLAAPSTETLLPTENAARHIERVEAIIGSEGGSLSHPGGARLVVPPGVFSGSYTVSLESVPSSSLRSSNTIELIPGTGYDIEVRDATGRSVTRLARPVTLQLSLPPDVDPAGAAVYSVERMTLTKLETVSNQSAPIRASLTHFSRFAAGTTIEPTGLPAWMIPWMAVAASAVILLAASAIAGSLQRRRIKSAGKTDHPVIQ
jgi:hypothetical protein